MSKNTIDRQYRAGAAVGLTIPSYYYFYYYYYSISRLSMILQVNVVLHDVSTACTASSEESEFYLAS